MKTHLTFHDFRLENGYFGLNGRQIFLHIAVGFNES